MNTPTCPALIVMPGGGGQRGESCDTLPPWTLRRLDKGIELFRLWKAASPAPSTAERDAPRQSEDAPIGRKSSEVCRERENEKEGENRVEETQSGSRGPETPCQFPTPILVPLSAGTTHRPPYITQKGWPVAESTSAAYYLKQRLGAEVSWPEIFRETVSLDTIGNAYILRTQIVDPYLAGVAWERSRKHKSMTSSSGIAERKAGKPRLPDESQRTCGEEPPSIVSLPSADAPTVQFDVVDVVVITSGFHMPRTKAIFDLVFEQRMIPDEYKTTDVDTPSSTLDSDEDSQTGDEVEEAQTKRGEHQSSATAVTTITLPLTPQTAAMSMKVLPRIHYVTVSDEDLPGVPAAVIAARSEREQQSLRNFERSVKPRFEPFVGTAVFLAMLQRWLWTEHTAYCSHDGMTPDVDISTLSAEQLATY